MVGRKRERAEAELELSPGRLLRLISSASDVFLQLFDGRTRVKHVRLPRRLLQAQIADAIHWASAQARSWCEGSQLSPDFCEALVRAVAACREPQAFAQGSQGSQGSVSEEDLLSQHPPVATADLEGGDDAAGRAVFNELGEEIGRAAFNAVTAARSSAGRSSSAETQRSGRPRRSVLPHQRFDPVLAERGGGGWSQYDLSRVGRRHATSRDEAYDELRAEARELRAHMDSLCKMISMPNSNFNVVMEHVAAVMLHQAVVREQPDSGSNDTTAGSDVASGGDAAIGNEADGDAPIGGAAGGDEARGCTAGGAAFGAAGGDEEAGSDVAGSAAAGGGRATTLAGDLGEAAVPPEPMTFSDAVCAGSPCTVDVRSTGIRIAHAAGEQSSIEGVPRNIPFDFVIDITSSQTPQAASCLVKMASIDKPVCISFYPRSAFDAIQRSHVKARDKLVGALERAHAAARARRRGSDAANGSSSPQKESARMRKGRELRELLRQVSKLHSAGQVKEAELLMEGATAGSSEITDALVKKRAQQLRSELFTYGGMELTRKILSEFLKLCEVRLLLPEHTRQAQKEMADSQTARELLQAAAHFIHEVLGSRGRRSDKDRNAFWASVVSLMPHDLKSKRKVASAMRLLQVPRRIINRALDMRGELEDRAQGWRRIVSSGHQDKVDGLLISEAWHSELLSSEDNVHKRSYAVYCGECDGEEQYDIHQRRAQHGTDKDALQRFRGSEFEAKLREATKTAKRPQGVGGSLKLLRQYKCICIKKRSASECDCKICTLVDVLLRRWHSVRHGWRTSWRKSSDGTLCRPPLCQCFICADELRLAAFMEVSQSIHKMMKVLLPCGKIEYAPYSLENNPFSFYDGRCCYGKCPKREAGAQARLFGSEMRSKVCGWVGIFGDVYCPLEATTDKFTWKVWEPRLRGTNSEGKPSYSPELVPKHGTRLEFMGELQAAIEVFLPHFWDHVMLQRGIKVHETLKDGVTATIRSDYAAQIKTIRVHNATCAHPESHNLCITVVGHSPYEETVQVKKRGKRPAGTKIVRKQKVAVFFGFHPSGIKPSVRSFNILREDVSLLLKTGKSRHGEWIHKGERLPGRDGMPALPAGLTDAAEPLPIFPEVEREDDLTDGCAAQFDGKDNYHQVSEWESKVGTIRNHGILVTMHGKNICDSLAVVINSAIQWAIKNEADIDPGTRALFLWLAANKQVPTVAKMKKQGWWAIEDIYYGYYDPKCFTQLAVPEAKGFVGSSEMHRFVSIKGINSEKARREGPIDVSYAWCGCANCCRHDFRNCLMKGLGGFSSRLKRVQVPRVQTSGAPSQSATLAEFAASLAPGQLRAVAVDHMEIGIEGSFWLCEVLSPAQLASEQQIHATDLFEEGWWIVEITWYKRVPGTHNKYKLEPNDGRRWLAVNAMIRVDGLVFEGLQRVSRTGVRVLSDRSRELIEACGS